MAQVAGEGGQFGLEAAGHGGLVVAGGDVRREVAEGAQGVKDQPPGLPGDEGTHAQQHHQADAEQDQTLGPGRRGHLGIEGGHAHEPAGGRNPGHGHELSLALPFVAEAPLTGGQGLLDEILLGHVLEQELFVHGMGDDPAGGIQDVAVAPLAEADRIDGFLSEDIPQRTYGHAAEQLAVRTVHGLGRDINELVPGGGLHG